MTDRVRPYLYYDVAVSICSTCYRKVEGKIVFQDDAVFMSVARQLIATSSWSVVETNVALCRFGFTTC